MIEKHDKEVAENLLKLNNSNADGLDEKENGFGLIYMFWDKSFLVSEGHMGRRMMESKKYINDMFEHAKTVEVNLKTRILTSLFKVQYGKIKEYVHLRLIKEKHTEELEDRRNNQKSCGKSLQHIFFHNKGAFSQLLVVGGG